MITEIYRLLLNSYKPQGWWPLKGELKKKALTEEEKLEICIGAILTQNTNWKNADKSIKKLHNKKLISTKKLAGIRDEKLAQIIKSSGYFRTKAKKIKIFCNHMIKKKETITEFLSDKNAREELLSIWGIGPETADCMLLSAGQRPVFVIDAYTERIMSRIGMCEPDTSYAKLQELFHSKLPEDHKIFNEYHALIVEHAKKHCTKNKPRCEECPIKNNCQYYKIQIMQNNRND